MEDKVANVYKEYKYLTFLHKETIDFILEHGNTSVAKEKAKILAQEIINRE